ncbi:MAG: hypothetical protein AB7Q29_09045 [Vicinamibacterales bacterium]
MRSRTARLALSGVAWIALGAAAFLAFESSRAIAERRASLRSFEATARDATDALDAAHAGQRAYVALTQTPGDWFPKVSTYLQSASTSIDALRASAESTSARQALIEAAAAMTELNSLDTRARRSVEGSDGSAAGAIVFVEAADAASKAVSNIDSARNAEQLAADAFEESSQRLAVSAVAATGLFSAVVLAVLGFARTADGSDTATLARFATGGDMERDIAAAAAEARERLSIAVDPQTAPDAIDVLAEEPPQPDERPLQALLAAADVCTAFARVRQAEEIRALLQRAADGMNARGLIVWLGTANGGALRPVLAHGYSEQTLARIRPIARDADNAAATAYRLGEIQTVASRPGGAQGAIVAPLLVADGCIGALTAEVRERGEQSQVVRALAAIMAAQLAGILQNAAEEPTASAPAEEAPSEQAASS